MVAVARAGARMSCLFRRRSGRRARRLPARGLDACRALCLSFAQDAPVRPLPAWLRPASGRLRPHDGRARAVCSRCGRDLAGEAGEGGQLKDPGLIEAVLRMERRIAEKVDSGRALALEARSSRFGRRSIVPPRLARSWPCGSRRPAGDVLSRPGRRREGAAGRAADPLAGCDAGGPAGRLRRGADPRRRDSGGGSSRQGGCAAATLAFGPTGGPQRARPVRPLERSAADYRRLAREILAHPDWIAAGSLPRRRGAHPGRSHR